MPNIESIPKDNTREIIKIKLTEKSRNKPNKAPTVNLVSNIQTNQVQPIQMVFTDGQFLQVLPCQITPANTEPICSNLNTISIHQDTDHKKTLKQSRNIKKNNPST